MAKSKLALFAAESSLKINKFKAATTLMRNSSPNKIKILDEVSKLKVGEGISFAASGWDAKTPVGQTIKYMFDKKGKKFSSSRSKRIQRIVRIK